MKILVVLLFFATMFGVSWIITCGLVKLITLCLGIPYDWGLATAVWLALGLLSIALKKAD